MEDELLEEESHRDELLDENIEDDWLPENKLDESAGQPLDDPSGEISEDEDEDDPPGLDSLPHKKELLMEEDSVHVVLLDGTALLKLPTLERLLAPDGL